MRAGLLYRVTDVSARQCPRAITSVMARTGVFGAEPLSVEDGGVVVIEFEGGGLATFVGGYWIPRWVGENDWVMRGTERWVRWDP